jgi:hypothetical protein
MIDATLFFIINLKKNLLEIQKHGDRTFGTKV